MMQPRQIAAVKASKALSEGQREDVLELMRSGYTMVDVIVSVAAKPRRIRALPKDVDPDTFMRKWRGARG